MDKLNVWATKIKRDIEAQDDNIYKRDYKFFKIDQLEQLAQHVDTFSGSCAHCQSLKPEIEDITQKISYYVNGSPSDRVEYERRNEKIVNHLKKEHKLSAEGYYASIYTLLGLLIGLIISFGLAFLLVEALEFKKIGLMLTDTKSDYPGSQTVRLVFLLGFIPSILIGRFLGVRKDKSQRRNKLIL